MKARKIRRTFSVVLLIIVLLVTQIPVTYTKASTSREFQIIGTTLLSYLGNSSSVTIPSSVKKIGSGAFRGINTLYNVTIPDTVEEIENDAFAQCVNLSSVSIGKNVNQLGNGAFAGCNNLSNVTISKDNIKFLSESGAIYNKDKTKLYATLGGSTTKRYTIPNTVEIIAPYSFWGNETIEELILSDGLEEITGYAFSTCLELRTIAIPNSVSTIDAKAFESCSKLKTVYIPASVSKIHQTAFDGSYLVEIIADSRTYANTYYEEVLQNRVVPIAVDKDEIQQIQADKDEATDTTILAKDDPSNVEYIPKNQILDIKEEGVLGKTRVVGQSAVVMIEDYGM